MLDIVVVLLCLCVFLLCFLRLFFVIYEIEKKSLKRMVVVRLQEWDGICIVCLLWFGLEWREEFLRGIL